MNRPSYRRLRVTLPFMGVAFSLRELRYYAVDFGKTRDLGIPSPCPFLISLVVSLGFITKRLRKWNALRISSWKRKKGREFVSLNETCLLQILHNIVTGWLLREKEDRVILLLYFLSWDNFIRILLSNFLMWIGSYQWKWSALRISSWKRKKGREFVGISKWNLLITNFT